MKILKWLDENFEEYFLMILLVMITLIMMLQIVMRYVFNASLSWPEELTRYCFVWSTFIGISYSIRRGTMLKIDAILSMMPKGMQKIIVVLTELIVLVFFGYLLFNSVEVVTGIYASGQKSPAIGIPMYIIYSCTIVGFSLAVLRSFQVLVVSVKDIVAPSSGQLAEDNNAVAERG